MKLLAIALAALFAASLGAADADKSNDSARRDSDRSSQNSTNDPVYLEYLKILVMDDAAQKEVDKWIRDADAFAAVGVETSKMTLPLRIEQRFKPVKAAYEDFIQRHPKHTDARLAYGSFLMDIHEEEAAVMHMEKAREIDPKNPAAWNNLANHYGHQGPVKKAFAYYEKAIELNPEEPVYMQNLATTTYLFRKDAQDFYRINEQQVFDRALELYRKAVKLDPTNLLLAVDYAQTYYGIRPMRTNDALRAWNHALNQAKTAVEQQGIYIHLARVELNTGRFDEAKHHLGFVTHPEMQEIKKTLERNWIEKRDKAYGVTNSAEIYHQNSAAKLN